jgi:SAM-dependent methyltransferase
VKNKTMSIVALVAMICNAATLGDLRAQNPSAKPMEHRDMSERPGDRMGGPSDRAFHRSFDDADKWAKEFDNPERDAWQKPEEILDALNLQRNSFVADIGAGTGYFSVRLAKRIPDGKIFAADIEPDMVRYLGERALREHLTNLVPVQASADAANLPDPIDVVLIDISPHRQPDPIFRQIEIIAADWRAAGDHRLQNGFSEWPARSASDLAAKGDGRTESRRVPARGDA